MSQINSYRDYVSDRRKACKYGKECYQKNLVHHQKYKHLPKTVEDDAVKHVNKKIKLDSPSSESISSDNTKDSVSRRPNEDTNKETEDGSTDIADSNEIKDDSCSKQKSIDEKENSADHKNISGTIDSGKEENSKQYYYNNDHGICIDETTDLSIIQQIMKEKFLVNMPDDFYKFWEFCGKLKAKNRMEALKEVGLILVGPFDVLAGKFNNIEKKSDDYLIHWRYFRDPPELQTILRGDDGTGFHIGYFRDSPDEPPVFLVGNHAKKNGIITPMGENIFSAVNIYLDDLKKTGDPFKRMHIGRIQLALNKEAEKLGIDISRKTKKMLDREKKIVARTFNKIGLVVPFDKKSEVGYRELAMDNKALNILLSKLQSCSSDDRPKYLSELQPVLTYASIAADECDFGTSIELGWNIIAHGVDCLNDTAMRFLVTGYQLLNRNHFAEIARAHMQNRRDGTRLSIL